MCNDITSERMKIMCEEWQKILRLLDWKVYVEICRARDLPDNVVGHSKIDILKKKTVVGLLAEIDRNPEAAWSCDFEKDLVHELLHLHFFAGDELSNAQYVAMEQGIEILAEALVLLKRGEKANDKI